MKKILFILEQEEEGRYAIERAIALAEKFDCSIHVLICCYEPLSWVNDIFGMLENVELKEKIIQSRKDWWNVYSKPYVGNTNLSHEIIWSKYFVDAILNHCSTHQYDFIVKKGHSTESIFFTPSDWLLLRRNKIPTYLVLSKQPHINAPILVALDLMASSEAKQTLNSTLLSAANDFSKKTGSELHCCFATPIPPVLSDTGFIDIEQHRQKIEKIAKEKAEILLEDYDIPPSNLHIKIGTPWKVINSKSISVKAGLIIVGSMSKTAVAGKIIGNTCEKVLHSSQKDVMVIGLSEETSSL